MNVYTYGGLISDINVNCPVNKLGLRETEL